MSNWGFWEWLGYAPILIAAIFIAAEGAFGVAPTLNARRPLVTKSVWLKFAPISLLAVSAISLFISNYDGSSNAMIIEQWGAADGAGGVIISPSGDRVLYGLTESRITVNGSLLQKYQSKGYQLVAVCLHHIGSIDIKDVEDISKSGKYDIEGKVISMSIPWNQKFKNEVAAGFSGTGYDLLAVPKNVNPKQFSTLREAIDLGSIRLKSVSGPP